MRMIRKITSQSIFVKDGNKEEDREFYYYKYRTSRRYNFRYKVTFLWEIYKDTLAEVGINWQDIKDKKIEIRIYSAGLGLHKIEFIRR